MSEKDNEQTFLLKEILKWIKFSGMKEVKTSLESVVNTPEKRIVYQLSDGKHSQRQIQRSSGVKGAQTISDLWRSWPRAGLGESVEVRKGQTRFKRGFDLDDFGIEYPPLPTTNIQNKTEDENKEEESE